MAWIEDVRTSWKEHFGAGRSQEKTPQLCRHLVIWGEAEGVNFCYTGNEFQGRRAEAGQKAVESTRTVNWR